MTTNQWADLQDRLAGASAEDLAAVTLKGLVAVWSPTEVAPTLDPDLAVSLDKALVLIARTLPHWGVALEGTAAGGSWTCTLRATGLRDDDEVMGIGRAEMAPLAMILALLHVLISRSKGYN